MAGQEMKNNHDWAESRDCGFCGKRIPDARAGQARFCSERCVRRADRASRRYKLTCQHCGAGFERKNSTVKYCGYECRHEARKAKQREYKRNSTPGAMAKKPVACYPLDDQPKELRALHPVWARFVRVAV